MNTYAFMARTFSPNSDVGLVENVAENIHYTLAGMQYTFTILLNNYRCILNLYLEYTLSILGEVYLKYSTFGHLKSILQVYFI